MRAPLLSLQDLCLHAADGVVLLEDISLEVAGGECVTIQGPSGSGKSLLLRSLAALDPATGSLHWQGQPIPPQGIPDYRAKVSLLAQAPSFPSGTVERALREPFDFHVHHGRHFDVAGALGWLGPFERDAAFLAKHTGALSGGEASLVQLVRALLLDPVVLLLDEPTSAMDNHMRGQLEDCVRDWCSPDRAVVWVTHDEEQAGRVATTHIQLRAGRRVAP